MVCGRLQRCRSDRPCYAARWLCLMELLSSLLLQGVQGRVLRAHTWVRPVRLRLQEFAYPDMWTAIGEYNFTMFSSTAAGSDAAEQLCKFAGGPQARLASFADASEFMVVQRTLLDDYTVPVLPVWIGAAAPGGWEGWNPGPPASSGGVPEPSRSGQCGAVDPSITVGQRKVWVSLPCHQELPFLCKGPADFTLDGTFPSHMAGGDDVANSPPPPPLPVPSPPSPLPYPTPVSPPPPLTPPSPALPPSNSITLTLLAYATCDAAIAALHTSLWLRGMDVPHSIDCQSPGLDAGVGLLELRLHLRGAAAASRLLDCLQQPAGDLGASLATSLNAPCGATLLLYATLSPPAAASARSSAPPVDTAPGHSSATPLSLACVLEQDPSLLPPGGSIARTLDVPAMCCGVVPGGPPVPEDSSSFEPSYPGASEESSDGSSDDGLPVEVSVYEASDKSGYVTKHQSNGDHSSGSSSGSTSVQEVGSEAVPGFFDWMTWLTVSLSSPLSCGEVALQLLDLVAKEGGLPALLDPGLGGVLDMWAGDNIACDSIRRGTFRDTTLVLLLAYPDPADALLTSLVAGAALSLASAAQMPCGSPLLVATTPYQDNAITNTTIIGCTDPRAHAAQRRILRAREPVLSGLPTARRLIQDTRHTFAALSLALATPQNAALDTERLASQQAQLVPASRRLLASEPQRTGLPRPPLQQSQQVAPSLHFVPLPGLCCAPVPPSPSPPPPPPSPVTEPSSRPSPEVSQESSQELSGETSS
ncbi:hypothetical protein V8C86DRAFT_3139263 [Haematococcus lacustris]